MNYLQISQFAQRRIGGGNALPGTAPTSVVGQSGLNYEIVASVNDCYNTLLNEQDSWSFLERRTTMLLPAGMNTIRTRFSITLTGSALAADFTVGTTAIVTTAASGANGPYGPIGYDMTVMAVAADIPGNTTTIQVVFNSPEAVAAQPTALPVGTTVATLTTTAAVPVAGVTATVAGFGTTYDTGDGGTITDYQKLVPFFIGPGVRYVQLWRTSEGVNDKADCLYVPWQQYAGLLDRNPLPQGKPWQYTVRPDGIVEFASLANEPMGVSTNYQFIAPPLVTDTDVPVFPERFHRVLGWAAARDWAGVQGQMQKYGMFNKEYERMMNDLRSSCTPEVLMYLGLYS
jgi:hypothetical protein